MPLTPFLRDVASAWQLLCPSAGGASHVDRLENFYRRQATHYDAFRSKLLHGREELWQSLAAAIEQPAATWIDFGGGTGGNFDVIADRVGQLERVVIVDPCQALTDVAKQRITANRWTNMDVVRCDASEYRADTAADVVTFSYALTMIPDWFAAIENACDCLRPGGLVGVADFYVSRKHAATPMRQHGTITRLLWPSWLQIDNVHPSPDHLPYLHRKFSVIRCEESAGTIPFIPMLRAPYYRFIGRKPDASPRRIGGVPRPDSIETPADTVKSAEDTLGRS